MVGAYFCYWQNNNNKIFVIRFIKDYFCGMLLKYYTRYWIKAGVAVHWNMDITKDSPRVMYVDYLIKKGLKLQKGSSERKVMVVGVKCHWLSDDGVYQTGRFNVVELIPEEILSAGQDELLRWTEFMKNGKGEMNVIN